MDEARFRTMRRKELNLLEILGRVLERRLTLVQAAEQLVLSVRRVARLYHRQSPSRTAAKLRASASIRACCSVSNTASRVVLFGRPRKSFYARTIGLPLLLRRTL